MEQWRQRPARRRRKRITPKPIAISDVARPKPRPQPGFGATAAAGGEAQASPTPSWSESAWSGFDTFGQLSMQLGTPSPSLSVSALPQPQAPGDVLSASNGQPSTQSRTKS